MSGILKIATRLPLATRSATRARRGLRVARWSRHQPTSYCDSPTMGACRALMIPPRGLPPPHSVITNHGRVHVSSTSMAWDESNPTSYAATEPDTPTAAAGDEPRSEQTAQIKHEYSHHAKLASQLSAEDLVAVIRAGGSSPDASLFQIKVLEWVADGTISVGSEQKVRRLGARAVMMRHGGNDAAAAAASEGSAAVGLTDEAVAGLTDDDVRCLAAWSATGGGQHRAVAGGALAAEQRVLDAQKHPAATANTGNADIPPMDRLLWGEPSVYPSASPVTGTDGVKQQAAANKGNREDDGLNELLAIVAAPLAVGAVTILGSLLVGRPLR